jgi:predicted Zn-dependent protease
MYIDRRVFRTLEIWLAILVATTAASCAMNPVSGMPEVTLVSVEQEKKIGAKEAKTVEENMGILDDSRLTTYLDAVGQRLAEESPRRDVAYRFQVVDTTDPNAFALPGGYVYVTRGLLALVNSEDELAGVVGHEIGHVAARHSVQRISKQGPFSMVFGIVSGLTGLVSPVVGNIVGGIGDFTQSLIFAPYSRGQETEADRVGQDMAAKAGWDPAGLSVFLATLEREVELMSKGPQRHSFFDSHPATPDRVAKTSDHARTLKRAARRPISPSRDEFLQRLDGLVIGQRAANGLFEGRRFIHPDQNFFLEFPEKWQIENSPQQVVAAAPEHNAALVLAAVAQGTDPLDGVRAIEKETKSSLIAKTQTVTINGLPAARTHLADSKVGIELTWIAHGGLVYQLAGIAPKKGFDSIHPALTAAAQSFRPLSAGERAAVREKRIRLVHARAGETIAALAARSNSAWTQEEIAVANGLAVQEPLKDHQIIKVTVLEPYNLHSRSLREAVANTDGGK